MNFNCLVDVDVDSFEFCMISVDDEGQFSPVSCTQTFCPVRRHLLKYDVSSTGSVSQTKFRLSTSAVLGKLRHLFYTYRFGAKLSVEEVSYTTNTLFLPV